MFPSGHILRSILKYRNFCSSNVMVAKTVLNFIYVVSIFPKRSLSQKGHVGFFSQKNEFPHSTKMLSSVNCFHRSVPWGRFTYYLFNGINTNRKEKKTPIKKKQNSKKKKLMIHILFSITAFIRFTRWAVYIWISIRRNFTPFRSRRWIYDSHVGLNQASHFRFPKTW